MPQTTPKRHKQQRLEPFQVEEQHPRQFRQTSEWRSLFEQLDEDRDGRIPALELLHRFQVNVDLFGVTAEQMQALERWADKNEGTSINFTEFCLLMAKTKHEHAKYAMLRAAQMVVPKNQRPEKFSYIEKYNCMPPPLFMILITLIEVGFYMYYAIAHLNDRRHASIWQQDSVVQWPYNAALYNPDHQSQVWRFLTYIFIHIRFYHIAFNCLTQLVLGVPLELVHQPHRMCAVYMAGVLYGWAGGTHKLLSSLSVGMADPEVYLVGASGGAYALIGAHVANLIVNWQQLEYPATRCVVLGFAVGADFGVALYNRLNSPIITHWSADPSAHKGHQVSYVAHIGGFIAGLFMGVIVLRNFKLHTWERVVWWMALVGFVVMFVFMIFYILVESDTI